MSDIVEWVKNYSMIFLLMTVVTSVASKKEYQKYIRLFVEIILVIALANPIFLAFGKSEDLFDKISFESFWQGLEQIRLDRDKMDFLNEDSYVDYYENAIAADVGLLAEKYGYALIDASIVFNDEMEAESLEIKVAKREIEPVVIGTISKEPEKEEITRLRQKIAAQYQMDVERVTILD